MLVNQVIGRAWRLGQTEVVVVYNLVCDQTVDCLMTDCAQGKGSMSEQFLASRHGRGWFKNVHGIPALTLRLADITKLLLSGKPPLEELPPDGAESTGDTAESMVSCQNGAEKGKSSAGSGKGKNFGEGE